uniref:hypothetical protein n=1 Tax=Escherichia coli TaxID=562 RepID=UPI003EB87CD6
MNKTKGCLIANFATVPIKGHLTEHIVHESEEQKREEDLDVVLKVLDSYIK